jgi:hypothetical protein
MEVDSRPDFVCNVTTTMTPFMKLSPIEARMWLLVLYKMRVEKKRRSHRVVPPMLSRVTQVAMRCWRIRTLRSSSRSMLL